MANIFDYDQQNHTKEFLNEHGRNQGKTVRTKEELEKAMNSGVKTIIVEGELAEKIKKTQKIETLGTSALMALATSVGLATAAAPFTGGLSYLAAAGISATTGLGISAVIVAASVGIATIIAIYRDYDVEFKMTMMGLRVKLTKK